MSRELPVPKTVKDLFDELLGRPVTIGPADPMRAPDLHAQPLSCLYVDDTMTLRAIIAMDIRLAAYTGAALGLVPATAAEASIEEKELSETIAENVAEVCNIMSSMLNHEGEPRVKVHQTFLPGQMPPSDAIGYMLAFGRRVDLLIDVQGYGAGRIWITLAKN
jgi:hypothetical protein